MKFLKRVFLILLILIVVVVGSLFVAPFLFQDELQQTAGKAINKQLNASVDFGEVDLSFFREFPHASLGISNISVVGEDAFAGDTLFYADKLQVGVDLWSLLGDRYEVRSVALESPRVHLRTLRDSSVNWDIVRLDTTAANDTSAAAFDVDLQAYTLTDGILRYDDATQNLRVLLAGIEHSGSGALSTDRYELRTQTEIERVDLRYDGISYLKRGRLRGNVDLNVDLSDPNKPRFELLENAITLNDFLMNLDGSVEMPGDDIVLDLSFSSPQTAFKHLLSLVPGVYTQDFADLQADGQLAFAGAVRGTYNENQLPGLKLDFEVRDGTVQYPDLPRSVSDIHVDADIDLPGGGDLQKLRVQIPRFSANFGGNPLSGNVSLQGLEPMNIDGELDGRLDLGNLSEMFPLEGIELRGLLVVDATAQGTYNEATAAFPRVDADLQLTDGYVRSTEFSTELTELNVQAEVKAPEPQLAAAGLSVPRFHFLLDGSPIDGRVAVQNFEDPRFDVGANGTLDLGKLMELFPLEGGVELTGQIGLQNFEAQGTYADIEAERYGAIATRGDASVRDLRYYDPELLVPITVEEAEGGFTGGEIRIASIRGKAGQSDYSGSGTLTNWLKYALVEGEPLRGTMRAQSPEFFVDEWLAEEETAPAEAGTIPAEAAAIPTNLDLSIDVNADKVQYTNLTLNNVQGNLRLVEGEARFTDVRGQMLGANLAVRGVYSTKNPKNPSYELYTEFNQLQVPAAYREFITVQQLTPFAKLIDGSIDLKFSALGQLNTALEPILSELNSEGAFFVIDGNLVNSKIMEKVVALTKLEALQNLSLDGAKGWFTIEDGTLEVKPFNIEFSDYVLTLAGRQGIDGLLDYNLVIDVPAEQVSQAAFSALNKLTGLNVAAVERVQLDLKIGGTFTDPQVSFAGSNAVGEVKDQVVEAGKDRLEQEVRDRTGVAVDADSLRQQARQAAEQARQRAQDSLRQVAAEARARARDSIQRLMDEQRRRAEEEAKNAVQDRLNKLKDRFGGGGG